MASNIEKLTNIEKRFIEVAGLDVEQEVLTQWPLTKETHLQVKTDKEKSDEFGEVFTPLWLVDDMLARVSDDDWKNQNKITLDMCSGYGQFTVRMLRKKQDVLSKVNKEFQLTRFLHTTHNFNEIQPSSCYKLLFIFSKNINLFIGDSRKLPLLSEDAEGILFYSDSHSDWINITKEVHDFLPEDLAKTQFSNDKVESFVTFLEDLMSNISNISNGTKDLVDFDDDFEEEDTEEELIIEEGISNTTDDLF